MIVNHEGVFEIYRNNNLEYTMFVLELVDKTWHKYVPVWGRYYRAGQERELVEDMAELLGTGYDPRCWYEEDEFHEMYDEVSGTQFRLLCEYWLFEQIL